MAVLINNLQDNLEVEEEIVDVIEQVVSVVLKREADLAKEVSIALVDDSYIHGLNHRYRGKDQPTDVLSFPQDDNLLLGDIIISLETAQRQAEEYNHSFAREVGFLTVHGMLHLLGYDHYGEEERVIMRKKEEEILVELGLNRD
ncbi:putative rRNA maturation factor [Orenia metallireducens]|jgi:probable rRNA maturation factor|uniref:Endoribonuclease YbeY n=1 Tax=Orenia metallireducens TaxID=1413210 RepID=A0A285G8T6_9FIRM|nr:rRNA maturation RNase YbeY [Orenia metallireducens]PRX28339.1 putative rRNA maturation factor [Orenia metallireducens]SNY18831.1 probable rRNA maturation factor [Orenia metallireducens]